MLRKIILFCLGLSLVCGCVLSGNTWQTAEDKENDVRFIPLELWTGETWDGKKEIQMHPVDFRFGTRKQKHITGPVKWHHPITRQDMMVYERINVTANGIKRQLFTVNPDKTGLSKVFDIRPGHKERHQTHNAVLFPLGWWKKGERREYVYNEYVGKKKYRRKALLRMRRLSFTYKGVKRAMKYDWIMADENGKIIYHERFIYGPGRGLISFKNRLKSS